MVAFVLRLCVLIICVLGTNSQQEADYVGCYSTTFASMANYGYPVKPLNWEICIHLCANKMTKFAGVQASKHMCYCGNDIADHSIMIDSSACSACAWETHVQCGGASALSLYLLTGYRPNVFLAAKPNGIHFIKDKKITKIPGLTQSATAVDYHNARNELFFLSGNKIFRSSYIPSLMKYMPPTMIFEASNTLSGIAVDWVKNNIYSTQRSTDKAFGITLDGNSFKPYCTIHEQYNKDVAFDPYMSLFSANDDYGLNVCNVLTKKNDFGPIKKFNFNTVLQVAIDIHQELHYVIGSFKDGTIRYLASTDYKYSEFRVLYFGPELSHPFTLDTFNGNIVWGNFNNNTYTLYRGEISPRGHLENITIDFQGTEKINHIKIYHPEAQTPSVKYSCGKKACSHTCVPVSLSYVTCECPDMMLLDEDGKTCVDKPTSTASTASSTIFKVSTNNPQQEVDSTTITEEPLSSELMSTSDFSTSPESSASNIRPLMTGSTTPASLLDKAQNGESSYSLIAMSFISIARDVILITLLVALLYFVIKHYRYNTDYAFYYNKNMEQAELTRNM